MLYRYSEIFRTMLMISDLSLVAASWALAYWIRFFTVWSAPRGIPGIEPYAYALLGLLPDQLGHDAVVVPFPAGIAIETLRLQHGLRRLLSPSAPRREGQRDQQRQANRAARAPASGR